MTLIIIAGVLIITRAMPQMLTKNSLRTYLLIHGGWHGSWCWTKVSNQLRGIGHKVITPDLPGHYRNNRDFKGICLNTYVRYIEDAIKHSSVPVTLVGHSMAGLVITQVAENMPENIDHLIYTCAFIPDNGGSLVDEEKKSANPSVTLEVQLDASENQLLLPLNAPERIRNLFYNCCAEEDVQFALSNLQPQPFMPFVDPVSFSNKNFGSIPKTYIECLKDNAISIQDQRRMYRKVQCHVETLDTDHSPFFSAPEQLVRILCKGPVLNRSMVKTNDDRDI